MHFPIALILLCTLLFLAHKRYGARAGVPVGYGGGDYHSSRDTYREAPYPFACRHQTLSPCSRTNWARRTPCQYQYNPFPCRKKPSCQYKPTCST